MLDRILAAVFPADETVETTVPTYRHGIQEDDINLQIRSISYCYARLEVEKLPPFYPHDTQNEHVAMGEGSIALDRIYNLEGFLYMLQEDPQRILVDWCKNKTRLMCILSETPLQRNINQSTLANFLVLEPESNETKYIQVLIRDSKLYCEHDVSAEWKTNCLKEVIRSQYTRLPTRRKVFNKQDRWQVMIKYLTKLAEYVQIERIYKGYKMQESTVQKPTHTIESEVLNSTKTLRSKPSMTILRLDNSVRVRSHSNSPVKMNQPNSPVIASRSPSPRKQSFSSIGSTQPHDKLYIRAKSCVSVRLEREKHRLSER